jgi:hypothetical protein
MSNSLPTKYGMVQNQGDTSTEIFAEPAARTTIFTLLQGWSRI